MSNVQELIKAILGNVHSKNSELQKHYANENVNYRRI